MKTYKVYELINHYGTVEYVGMTSNLKNRFQRHTKTRPHPTNPSAGYGKFFGRQDLIIHLVSEFSTRQEAELFEGQLKLSHGMEWTERTRGAKNRIFIADEHKIGIINDFNNSLSLRKLEKKYGYDRKKIAELINGQV